MASRPLSAPAAALVLAVASAAFAGCGDDGKGTGSPRAGAPPPPESGTTSTPSPSDPTDDLAGWTRAAPGDFATWEIRVEGETAVTRLTWRALDVRAGIVRYAVESSTRREDFAFPCS